MKKIILFCAAMVAALGLNAQTVLTAEEAYNAAIALNAGDTLTDDNGQTAIVEVTAYVTDGTNGTINNGQQTFYIGQTADEAEKTLQVYKCDMPENEAAVNKGDKVKITGKLMHYVNKSGTMDVAELVKASAEVLERASVAKVDTIRDMSVCEIIEEGESLKGGQYTKEFFEITVSVDSLTYTNGTVQTFFTFCEDNHKSLQAYNAQMQDDVIAAKGDSVKIVGKITLYAQKNQVEFESPQAWVVFKAEQPKVDTIETTINEIRQVGEALEQNAVTKEVYVVMGYVDSIAVAYSEEYGNISFFITEDMENPTYDLQVFRGQYTEDIPVGTEVIVTGNIKRYYKAPTETTEEIDMLEIVNGVVELPTETGLKEVINMPKAQKILLNGNLIIKQGNTLYNATGSEIR